MRQVLLIPLLCALGAALTTASQAAAEDSATSPATESADAVQLAKSVALGIQNIKDSTGSYPASATVPVTLNGLSLQMVTTVTVLPAAFSLKTEPTPSTLAHCPVSTMAIDILGSTLPTLTLSGIYATGSDKADIVGFSTSGSDFAISYALNGKSVESTANVQVAPEAVAPAPPKATFQEYHLPGAAASGTAVASGKSSNHESDTETESAARDDSAPAAPSLGVMHELDQAYAKPLAQSTSTVPQISSIARENP